MKRISAFIPITQEIDGEIVSHERIENIFIASGVPDDILVKLGLANGIDSSKIISKKGKRK